MVALVLSAAAASGDDPSLVRGRDLYARHCSVCHGETGRGDGPGAALNRPLPRDFGTGRFRLVSTTNGVPSDDDLLHTLRTGIPGTGMPPWGHMPDADLRALAVRVRELTREATVLSLLAQAKKDEEEMSEADARRIAAQNLTPGPAIAPGDPGAATPERLARGAAVFRENCAKCHGEDGRGMRDPTWKTAEGEPIASRDLRSGRLKGGDGPDDLYRRIAAGIPGTPMPAHANLAAEDIWSVVHHVRSLRTEVAREAPLPAWWLPVSANAQGEMIDHDFHLTVLVTGAVGFLALAGLALAIGRALFRRDAAPPPWRPGSRIVEAVWVAVPAVIVIVMVVNSWVVFRELTRPLDGALRIRVTGRQYFWSFEYPDLGARSAGTAAVPAGRPVRFEIGSQDVIHSFFVPHLKMKRDAIPGVTTDLWVRPIAKPGAYPILCNQLCGTDHAVMNGAVEVMSEEAFAKWIAARTD